MKDNDMRERYEEACDYCLSEIASAERPQGILCDLYGDLRAIKELDDILDNYGDLVPPQLKGYIKCQVRILMGQVVANHHILKGGER